jgi:hypothetical protein
MVPGQFLRELHRVTRITMTGVAHKDVNAAELLGRSRDEVLVVLLLCDITFYRNGSTNESLVVQSLYLCVRV